MFQQVTESEMNVNESEGFQLYLAYCNFTQISFAVGN